MAQTVIGLFDNASEAQQAVQQLTAKGFSRDQIDVSNSGAQSSSSYASTDTHTEEGGIGHFFKSLFSDDDDSSDKYATVARRSGAIVTVHAQSADQAENAADILDDCGAVNVDERASSYGYTGAANTGVSGAGSYAASTNETTKIPIIEENLEVGKREVLTGGTRL
ncbi:MAG TPA: general stress protein, partial [Segetibacter sp.]